MSVTSNADQSRKDGSGQRVSPVIPSCAYPILLLLLLLLLFFLFLSFLLSFPLVLFCFVFFWLYFFFCLFFFVLFCFLVFLNLPRVIGLHGGKLQLVRIVGGLVVAWWS